MAHSPEIGPPPIRLATLPRQHPRRTGTGFEKPSLSDARATINALRRLDLTKADLDQLRERVRRLMGGLAMVPQDLVPGLHIFRGVKWASRPDKLSQLSYPPADRVRILQRVNRPGRPCFYASVGPNAPFYELRSEVGDRIALSVWRVKKKGLVNHIGYVPETFKRLGSGRGVEGVSQFAPNIRYGPVDRLVHGFLAAEFSKDVAAGFEHQYKMTVAIAEIFLSNIATSSVKDEQFAGLLYPALAMHGNADNLCLVPEFVDHGLEFVEVDYVRVDQVIGDDYLVATIDHALRATDGLLQWLGPRQRSGRPGRLRLWRDANPGIPYQEPQ